MRKAVSAVVMATMVTSFLTGCGGSSGTATTAAPSVTQAMETTAGKDGGMVSFEIWHSMEGSNGEAFEAMVKTFNETKGKELGITANSVFQGNDTASKLKTLIQTEDLANMPDVCMVYNASLPVVADYKNTIPVADMYGKGIEVLAKEDINQATVQTYTYQGKQISMPFNSSTLLLYYNVDAFKEAGLDPENPPQTLEEIGEACQKLTIKDGNNVTRYGFNTVLDRYQMVNLIGNQGNGTYFGDNEGGRTGLITKLTCEEEMKQVFQAWETLAATGGFKYTYDNQNEEFATGKSAMTMMSSARIGSITKLTQESGVNWAVTNLPDINTSTDNGGACIGGASLALFDKGDEVRTLAAWEFIQYTASAETQSSWSQATGYLPINLKTKDLGDYKTFVEGNPAVQIALEQFESSNPMVQEPVMMMQGSIDAVIKEASTNVCEGAMTADEATAFTVKECNKLFEEYNRANQ